MEEMGRYRISIRMGLSPWLQVVRGIGTSVCEDHLLAAPRIKKVCDKKGGDGYRFSVEGHL